MVDFLPVLQFQLDPCEVMNVVLARIEGFESHVDEKLDQILELFIHTENFIAFVIDWFLWMVGAHDVELHPKLIQFWHIFAIGFGLVVRKKIAQRVNWLQYQLRVTLRCKSTVLAA